MKLRKKALATGLALALSVGALAIGTSGCATTKASSGSDKATQKGCGANGCGSDKGGEKSCGAKGEDKGASNSCGANGCGSE